MKIEIQQLTDAKKKLIVDCLRKIGERKKKVSGYSNNWYLEIAREIEHVDLLIARYNYPKQEKEAQP